MKGVIVTNGYYSSEASRNQAERMAYELAALGAEVEIIKNNRPIAVGESFGYDFAVFFDKDVNLAKNMELDGVVVYNSSSSIEAADDKIRSALVLAGAGIAFPETVPAPKRYAYDVPDEELLRSTGERLGYPLVVKSAAGSLGEQVFLARNYEELIAIDRGLGYGDRLYQRYVEGSRGQSIRAIVIGKKLFCAMKLINASDFRSNAHNGGVGEKIELGAEFVTMAERAAEEFKLDYCGVDMFVDSPSIIEINSNAYFEAAEKVTEKNVARAYAEHIIRTTKEIIRCRNLRD